MNPLVNLEELTAALDWVSSGEAAGTDCEAFISKATGHIHWSGEGVEEALPDDIGDDRLYVAVPGKQDLDLGRSLALRFVQTHLPQSVDAVHQYFRKRGAYSRFKAMLEQAGELEAWYGYERNAIEAALREWCEENDLTLGSPAG